MTTPISKEQFLQDVRTEVESLKANVTAEEVSKLDLSTFDADSKQSCIYGQMTGRCDTKRAKELMDKSCVRVTKDTYFTSRKFENLVDQINGEYTGQTWGEDLGDTINRSYHFISMLEMYIFLKGASPKNIIDYLKGDVETLELPLY